MFHIVLYEPEIPPNTGNIIRLCANTGAQLHIIKPAAFDLDDAKLKRAGLDYHEFATVMQYNNLAEFQDKVQPKHMFACSTKGRRCYADVSYQAGDAFLFGPETRGLPAGILNELAADQILRVPMLPNSRSLNLSNTVAVFIYEAWRQNGFRIQD
jgi:tRNA (cytidine/uridine-2'-O-)-methyltransferase